MHNCFNPINIGGRHSAIEQHALKRIQDEIHLKTLQYVDFFTFFWFYSHGKIKVVEKKTATLLHARLNSVKYRDIHRNSNGNGCKLLEDSLLAWKSAYTTFMGCMQEQFHLPLKEYMVKRAKSKPASFEDFCMVATLIKREPEGLLSILGANYSSENNEELKNGVVATVAPFITRKTPVTTSSSGHPNDTLRQQYERNRMLYSQSMYPLDVLFDKECASLEVPEELQKIACSLASSLFQIINFLLDPCTGDLPSDAEMLALHIEQLLLRDSGKNPHLQEACKEGTEQTKFSIQVKDYLSNQFGGVIKTVANWTPFPTCFWLIDKNMQIAASEYESNGALDKIRQKITKMTESLQSGDKAALDIIQRLYMSNASFIITRMSLVHPMALQFLYASIINSTHFRQWLESGCTSHYVDMSSKDTFQAKSEAEVCMQMLNVLRATGIAGNRNFLKIKCLHAHFAFSYAQDDEHGRLIKELMSN